MRVFGRLFKLFIYVIITPLFVTGVFLFYYQNYSKKEILQSYAASARLAAGLINQDPSPEVFDLVVRQRFGASGAVYFADGEGTFLGLDQTDYAPPITPAAIATALAGQTPLITDLNDDDGQPLVGAFAPARAAGIYVLILQHKREAYHTINLISWLIAFFIMATTTLSYFAALSFSQEISAPIEQLTAAARAVEQNDFNVHLDTSTAWGEFEILMQTFNAMAAGLNQYQALQLDKILDEKKKTDMLARFMRDGVIMCDGAGQKLFANQTAEEILQTHPLAALLKTKSGAVLTTAEEGLPSAGPKTRHFEVNSQLFSPAGGEGQIAIILLRDITTEHEIREMKNDIFNSIAHDLRAPLLGLQAYIMILQESADMPPAKREEALKAMEQSSQTLSALVENILDSSKLERGLLLPNKTVFELRPLAQKVIDTLAPLAQKRGDELQNNVPAGAQIYADKNLLERVLVNLISNSVKFTKNGSVSVSFDAGAVAVADSGQGLKEADLPKIFDKYYQADGAFKGHGLGLSIVKQIITAHGGEIKAASQEGKGAKFSFTLPSEK